METGYCSNPLHPVSIIVVGAGGNGSQMIQQLGRMNHALLKLGKTGLHVTLYDDDRVSPANIGRQLFTQDEIGEYKSVLLITRINRFYATNWEAVPARFTSKTRHRANVIITCVDNVPARIEIDKYIKGLKDIKEHEKRYEYWMDLGNTKTTGQVICASRFAKLPTVVDRYPNMRKMEQVDDTPSCSLMEALQKQDLFINTFVSNVAAKLLWEILTKQKVNWCGAYINLDTLNFKKIPA